MSSPLFSFATQPATGATPSTGFGGFSTPLGAPSPSPSPFQIQPQIPQQQQIGALPQSGQQHLGLVTNDRTPVSYNTKWADIHPDSQHVLQKIEEKILEYRDESWRLDQCERLYDTAALNKGFELDAARISQELSGVGIATEREQSSLQELMKSAKDMLRNTEVAVRSFMMLCIRFPRPSTNPSATPAPPAAPAKPTSQAAVYVSDFYSGVPVKPSPYIQQTVARFETRLAEYRQWTEALERLLLQNDRDDQGGSELSLLQSLPAVMANVHDFFIYVAAEVESLHEFLESMRLAFLANQRRKGEDNDPFLEADRRETAKREAAAKRVHPSALKPAADPSGVTSGTSSSGGFGTPVPTLPSAPTQTSTPSPGFINNSQSLFTPSAPSIAASTPIFSAPSSTGFFGTGSAPASTAAKPKTSRTTRRR